MSTSTETQPWKVEWSDQLSLCIPEIDAEHKRFILLINALNEAIAGRLPLEEIKRRMQLILDDAEVHFAHEEALFREWGYPDAEEHALQHADVLKTLHETMSHFDQGRLEYEWIKAGLTVKQVLVEHLLTDDMKCRDYCCAKRGG